MSNWTDKEKMGYKRVVGALIAGDAKRKKDLDARAAKILSDLHEQAPDASQETLAEFGAITALIAATFLRSTVEQAGIYARRLYEVYSVVTAQLIGVYDPSAEDVPSNVISEALAALGLDEEMSQKVWDLVNGIDKPKPADGNALTGQYL